MNMNNRNKRGKWIETVKKLIVQSEVVSFDFYDTLFVRDVEKPTDVFLIMQELAELKDEESKYNFFEKRIEAEKAARKKKYPKEVTIDDIYQELKGEFQEEDIDVLKDMEMNIEINICTINHDMLDIFNYAKSIKKKVIIISDFYIGNSFIKTICEKNGISADEVFVSCDLMLSKFEGTIYKYVCQRLNITFDKLVHIGDNYNSDFSNAVKLGINGVWYQKPKFNYEYNILSNGFHSMYIKMFQLNHYEMMENRVKQLGYMAFGPFLYNFCVWLQDRLIQNGIERVYFFSRDGLIIKKAFDFVCDNKIKTYYFLTSRRALQVPIIHEGISLDELFEGIYLDDLFSVHEFLNKLGLSNDEIVILCKKFNIEDRKILSKETAKSDTVFINFFENILPVIVENAEKERNSFKAYLDKMDFRGKCAVVDIGWFGNMQFNLQKFLKEDVLIYGYYVALNPNGKHQNYLNMEGYLFDKKHNIETKKIQAYFTACFETIFSANHGSVEKYSSTSNVGVILKENEHSLHGNWDIIGEFQSGALEFVKSFNEKAVMRKIEYEYAVNSLFDIFMYPTVEDARIWASIFFYDKEVSKIVDVKGSKYYLLHPYKFILDFRKSRWKPGFINANTGCRFNYYKVTFIKDRLNKLLRHNS